MEKQKVGRPRKSTDDIKGKQIRVRLTDDEKEKLKSLAKKYDVSQSEFVRILISNYYVYSHIDKYLQTIKNSKSNKGGKANA